MFDVNFDSGFNLNSLSVNGIDTVAMYDQLNANGDDDDDRVGGYLPLLAVAIVVGGAIWLANRDDDGQCPQSNNEEEQLGFGDGPGGGGAFTCEPVYD